MKYCIDELTAVVPPPDVLTNGGNLERWKAIAERIDQPLPPDLLDLSLDYGCGEFVDGPFTLRFINVFHPGFVQLIEFNRIQLRLSKDAGHREDESAFSLGSFVWDGDDQGDEGHIWWRTIGDPEEWPVCISCELTPEQRFDMPLIEFMLKAFQNELALNRFPQFTNVSFVASNELDE